MKVESKLKKFQDKCDFYISVSLSLAKNGKIEVLKELKHSINEPALNICILRGIFQYYLNIGNKEIAERLLNEAFLNLKHIKDNQIRSMLTITVINLALKLDKLELYTELLDDLLFRMERIPKESDGHRMLRMNLYQVLLISNQKEKAKELIDIWNKDFYDKNTELFIVILDLLFHLDREIRSSRLQTKTNPESHFLDYYKVVFDALDLMDFESIKDESRYFITLNMAKNGFYKEAINMRDSMEIDFGTKRIDASLPFSALNNGHFEQAMEFASSISDEKTRLDIYLCISLYLAKDSKTEESFEMIKNWAIYNFDLL